MIKHSMEQTAAWAKDWGIKGYEHLDPQARERHKRIEMQKKQARDRGETWRPARKSSQRKKFNKSVTFRRRG
tara:strand:+ start:428 stop:643 length:216 start_codon:yes stop_codon:yes gene_type:complete